MRAISSICAAAALLSTTSVPAVAQWPGDPPPPVTIPALRAESATPDGFLPVGWKVEAIRRGLIDADERADAVMVIKDTKRVNLVGIEGASSYDSNPRLLVVILGTAGGFRLGEQNASLIPRLDNMNQDDLFDSLTLSDRTIAIAMHEHFEAGGWKTGTTAYKLRWNGAALVAIGFDFDGQFRDLTTRRTSANFLTGKVIETNGTMDGTHSDASRTISIPRKTPTLREIGNGLMYDPVPR